MLIKIYCIAKQLQHIHQLITNRVDTTDPDPLYIADQVADALSLGNAVNPIPVYVNGVPYMGGSGATGPAGSKGDKGDTGAKGDTGFEGDTGAQGIQGDTGLAEITLSAVGSSPNINGAALTGTVLNLELADG